MVISSVNQSQNSNKKEQKRASYLHEGGSVLMWACFVALGPVQLAKIKGNMNYSLNKKILKD